MDPTTPPPRRREVLSPRDADDHHWATMCWLTTGSSETEPGGVGPRLRRRLGLVLVSTGLRLAEPVTVADMMRGAGPG